MEAFQLPFVLSASVVLLFSGALLAKTVSDAARQDGMPPPRLYMPLLSLGATFAMCLIGAAVALAMLGQASWWHGIVAFVAAFVGAPIVATVVGRVLFAAITPVALSVVGAALALWWLASWLPAFLASVNR